MDVSTKDAKALSWIPTLDRILRPVISNLQMYALCLNRDLAKLFKYYIYNQSLHCHKDKNHKLKHMF